MKVLHIIPSMEIGGAQRLLSDLLPLQMKQADVTLLVFKSVNNALVDKLVEAGVKVISLEVNNVYNPLIIFKLKKYIKGYDVVHVHLFPALYWVAFASGSIEGKLIFTEHSTSNSRRGKRWL
ncbi:MAG: glycosyltransferase, partial [Bacteroidales bacterium]|nr:glycosyltransferase [Bacteroidales bacterium]